MKKEDIVKWLMQKDTNVLMVAVVYAENYLRYGIDITKKAETAAEMAAMLENARIDGYLERMAYERKNSEQNLHRRSKRRD